MHQFVAPTTPRETPITNVIREALLNRTQREDQYNWIMDELFVSRNKAKEMYYAFIWYADEEYLTMMMLED